MTNPPTLSFDSSEMGSVAVRLQLQSALEFVQEGDVFVVTKLDRLARWVADLMGILQTLERKRVAVRILDLSTGTQTPTGRLMVSGGVAQFEPRNHNSKVIKQN